MQVLKRHRGRPKMKKKLSEKVRSGISEIWLKKILPVIKFILIPTFTKIGKDGKIEFNPVYFYIFVFVILFIISAIIFMKLIWLAACGEIENVVAVLTAAGGLVSTQIIIIDRMMVAYNKGKEDKHENTKRSTT